MNTSYEVYCTHLDIPLLIIPVEDTKNYSTKPLKWIRYATAAVLGSEGDLMKYSEDDIDVETCKEDLTLDMEDQSPSERKLTFHPTSPIRFIDKDACYASRSDVTQDTESQASFKNKTAERDGSAALVTHLVKIFVDPCHIIPFAKGSEYIQAVDKWRNDTDEPEIKDIDDIRNGLFLDYSPHKLLATGMMGVLHTPNFALSTNEILPRRLASSLTGNPKRAKLTKLRFTPHYLSFNYWNESRRTRKASRYFLQRDFRYPNEMVDGWPVDWPPAFLWDFNYGVAVAKRYGNEEAMEIMNNKTKSHYYPEDSQKVRDRARFEIQSRREDMRAKIGRECCQEGQMFSDTSDNLLTPSMLFGVNGDSRTPERVT